MVTDLEGDGASVDPRVSPTGPMGVDRQEPLQPSVASAAAAPGPWLIGGVAALIGLVVTLWLATHRPHQGQPADALPSGQSTAAMMSAPPPPPELAAMEAQGLPRPLAPTPAVLSPAPLIGVPPPPVVAPPAQSAAQTGKAPVLVVDFSRSGAASAGSAGGTTPGKAPESAGKGAAAGLNADEQFLARIEGGAEPARASATMLRNQSTLIPQGTTIPAVLETALDSDLPGYARAVVSRDVRGFDASTVLIPRGSRVIGEYRSAVAQGQTRAFVIWTRILRPDGASIMIGSGGGDTLGRAGLAGKVDTHFLEEFSGAVLLTVLQAAGTAVAGVPSTEVVIGSAGAGAAGSLAGPLAAFAPVGIPPTIKVAQGTPLLIFVQRDLDFTRVEGESK